MLKAGVLSVLMVTCAGLKMQKPAAANGITYSLKAKDQEISNKKMSREELMKIVKGNYSGPMKDVGNIDDYLELWYVNTKKAVDRRQCMDGQIKEMKMKSHMYPALNFHQCTGKSTDIVKCLTENGYGDCVKRGIQAQGISTHGSQGEDGIVQAYHIISNACSHKRMMEKMLKLHTQSNSKAKYAVLLEDDVAFDRHDFVRKVVNFANMYQGKYNETWHMVQIDPFGSKCDKHIIGSFEGLPVWKPTNVNNNHECSNYWGAHALLVRYDKIPAIISHMELHPTVPLDWLPAEMDHGIAWQANIAKNPEAQYQVYAGQVHHQWAKLPDYCKDTVKQSTIARNLMVKA